MSKANNTNTHTHTKYELFLLIEITNFKWGKIAPDTSIRSGSHNPVVYWEPNHYVFSSLFCCTTFYHGDLQWFINKSDTTNEIAWLFSAAAATAAATAPTNKNLFMLIFRPREHASELFASVNYFCYNFSIIGLLISVRFLLFVVHWMQTKHFSGAHFAGDDVKMTQNYWFQCSIWFLKWCREIRSKLTPLITKIY